MALSHREALLVVHLFRTIERSIGSASREYRQAQNRNSAAQFEHHLLTPRLIRRDSAYRSIQRLFGSSPPFLVRAPVAA